MRRIRVQASGEADRRPASPLPQHADASTLPSNPSAKSDRLDVHESSKTLTAVGSVGWQGLANSLVRRKAENVLREVVERLGDPEQVQSIAMQPNHPSAGDGFWIPFSLTQGDASLAMLFGQLDRSYPDQHWDGLAHKYLVHAVRPLEQGVVGSIDGSLFTGLAGLCFVTRYLSRGETRYKQILLTLDTALMGAAEKISKIPQSLPVGFSDYDLIRGPVGIGAYLLTCLEHQASAHKALERVIDRLLFLCESEHGQLGYFISPERMSTDMHRVHNPKGAIDCGLAHGVAGSLGFLSLAYIQGIKHPGLRDGIKTLADWLLKHRLVDAWGVTWPTTVPPDRATQREPDGHSRASWCYGSPGIARSLWFAGRALQDKGLSEIAMEAFLTVLRRPNEVRALEGPILCHGIAGLLQVVLRFANESHNPTLWKATEDLIEELVLMFEPEAPMGFRYFDDDGNALDNPGFLSGSAGIALTLLAATTEVEPSWDRILLLS